MPGFNSYGELINAINNGQTCTTSTYKVPDFISQGNAGELSSCAGIGRTNGWPGLAYTSTIADPIISIPHGGDVSPAYKYLLRSLSYTNGAVSTSYVYLCDLLLYYPSVDLSTAGTQLLTNSTSLPRYTDGIGNQIIVVNQQIFNPGRQRFYLTYTNSDGVSGRKTAIVTIPNTNSISSILLTAPGNTPTASAYGIFMPLQGKDIGVRSVESITMLDACTVPAVVIITHPLQQTITSPVAQWCLEIEFGKDRLQMPRIYDGAVLHQIIHNGGATLNSGLFGILDFVWN